MTPKTSSEERVARQPEGFMTVQITQFMRPDGRQTTYSVDGLNDSVKPQYDKLRASGCRLTAEVLMTGAISQCVEHEECDFDCEITFKQENAKADLEKLIARFDEGAFQEWLTAVTA